MSNQKNSTKVVSKALAKLLFEQGYELAYRIITQKRVNWDTEKRQINLKK